MFGLHRSFQLWADERTSTAPENGFFAATEVAAPSQIYTYDQIAAQLTVGYWSSVGQGQRAFDVSAGGTLHVDITGLDADGQAIARMALDAWSLITGINFDEIAGWAAPLTTWSEIEDAASGTATPYNMGVGDDFCGTLSAAGDRDAISIFLAEGQSITIALNGDSSDGAALADPYLRLMNGAGTLIGQNDDADGYDSILTYQVITSGTYYIQAGSYADSLSGDYVISVRDGSQSADITFDDELAGAFSNSTVAGTTIQSSFVNVNATWAGGGTNTGSYYFQTYLHEIGHALGLGHSGNYNGSAVYSSDALYLNDSWQASLMSYFHQTENTWLDASFAYAITPMMADILAIQNLYGTPEVNAGDTIYGEGGNSGTYLDGAISLSSPVAYTIFDTGGVDTFDFSSQSAHQRLDLREETYSDLVGLTGNIGIARGTVIERGLTGGGNDTLVGNDVGNGLSAGAGNDTVEGGSGNDALRGGIGADTLSGGAGADLIEGGSGFNLISGGTGSDLLVGEDVTLGLLEMLYPDWSAPPEAQDLLDNGYYLALWDDIISEIEVA